MISKCLCSALFITVRNVTGTAVGCGGFVRSTCVETGDMVLVIRRFLDSRDPRSLHCESGASEVRVEISEYPRCDENTGLATSCATLDVTEVPYPRKHAGMVTL